MKSPKEISVDQKLIALTKEIIELTAEKPSLSLLVVKELIDDSRLIDTGLIRSWADNYQGSLYA